MILRISYEGDREPTDVTTNPTESDVADAVRSMDWNRFAFVTLLKDDGNWLDGSGCLEPDFGLSMMLSVERIQYVTETAPPTPSSMLPVFNAYLRGDDDSLFALIYDATRRGLTADDIARLCRKEATTQRKRMLKMVVVEAAELFAGKDYAAFIQKLAPFESLLGASDAKKLAVARKKHAENTS